MKLMKFDYIFILAFLFFISCKEREIENSDDINIVYNIDEYMKLWIKDKNVKVEIIDTFCENQTKKAKRDIANNKLTYFDPYGYYEHEELGELLHEHNIKIERYNRYCVSVASFNPYCYQDLMRDEITKRYGETFLDSLWKIAEKNFVLKYPDSLYIKDGRNVREKYITVLKK